MKFDTNISKHDGEEHHIYGQNVSDLMRNHSFTETIFLLYCGKLPSEGERILLDAMLVAAAEHGVNAPSLYTPRISAASGNSVHVAMAAGILAIGEEHGGAGEAAALLLSRSEKPEMLVDEYYGRKERMPGFGHRVYKEGDPRADIIFDKAQGAGVPLASFDRAYAIERALEKKKGKKFPLNIDGAFAAGVLALGMDARAAKALFVLARVSGMGAHAIEELHQRNGYRRGGE